MDVPQLMNTTEFSASTKGTGKVLLPHSAKTCVHSLSCAWLLATPWTVAYQASLSMGFSRQQYWSRLPFPSPRDLPHPGLKRRSALQADSFPTKSPGKPKVNEQPSSPWRALRPHCPAQGLGTETCSLTTFPRGWRGEARPSRKVLWGVEEASLEEAVLLKGFTFISGSKDLLTK